MPSQSHHETPVSLPSTCPGVPDRGHDCVRGMRGAAAAREVETRADPAHDLNLRRAASAGGQGRLSRATSESGRSIARFDEESEAKQEARPCVLNTRAGFDGGKLPAESGSELPQSKAFGSRSIIVPWVVSAVRIVIVVMMIIIPIPGDRVACETGGSGPEDGGAGFDNGAWAPILVVHGGTTHAGSHQRGGKQDFNKAGFHRCIGLGDSRAHSTPRGCGAMARAVPLETS
jgi:hypothetical protein